MKIETALTSHLLNLKVVIARDDAGIIHGFLGVDENRIEMLFVDDANRGIWLRVLADSKKIN